MFSGDEELLANAVCLRPCHVLYAAQGMQVNILRNKTADKRSKHNKIAMARACSRYRTARRRILMGIFRSAARSSSSTHSRFVRASKTMIAIPVWVSWNHRTTMDTADLIPQRGLSNTVSPDLPSFDWCLLMLWTGRL